TLFALAVLAASGASFAQSSVTLFGVVDAGYRSVTSGDNKFSGMQNGSNSSNRLGFKGTEDLGNGLTANFALEGDLAPNDGTASGFAFKRQSVVGLAGAFGEVRLGRDYTPAFKVFGIADPFGTVGVGSAGNIMWSTAVDVGSLSAQDASNAAGTFVTANRGTGISTATPGAKSVATLPASLTIQDPNLVRGNNTFAYYTPAYYGVTAAAMYSAGTQNTASEKAQGKMTSLSGTYANGPLTVALANQVTKGGNTGALDTASTTTLKVTSTCTGGTSTLLSLGGSDNVYKCVVPATYGVAASDDQKMATNFLAGSYDFGIVKASAGYRTEKWTEAGVTAAKTKSAIYGLSAPVGALTLKASYITKKVDFNDGDIKAGTQTAVGAVYDLSKRTAFYATYAVLKNEDGFANSVGSAAASAGGVKSKGFDIGVRHSF
ncbi:MAG: porin, partial [Limnohabitans sp.]